MKSFTLIKKSLLWTFIVLAIFITLSTTLIYIYKNQIISRLVKELNQYLTTKIEVSEDIDSTIFKSFPQISIEFKKVRIFENMPGRTDKTLGEAGKVYICFNTYDLLDAKYNIQKVIVEDGVFRIYIDKNGSKNYHIINTQNSSDSTINFSIKDIIIKNIRTIYQNEVLEQKHEFMCNYVTSYVAFNNGMYSIEVKAKTLIDSLHIEGSNFFVNKAVNIFTLFRYNDAKELLTFENSDIHLDSADFTFKGKIKLSYPKEVDLEINEENASIQTLISLLPEKYSGQLKKYNSTGRVYCQAHVSGQIGSKKNPFIEIKFGTSDLNIHDPAIPFPVKNISFTGKFSNGLSSNLSSSLLEITKFKGFVNSDLLTGHLTLKNFSDMNMDAGLKGDVAAAFLNPLMTKYSYSMGKGKIGFDINLKGRIKDLQKVETAQRIQSTGVLTLKNIEIAIDKQLLNNIQGNIVFDNNDLLFKSVRAEMGANNIMINADCRNIISRLFYKHQPYYILADVTSSFLSIDDILRLLKNKDKNLPISSNSIKVEQAPEENIKINLSTRIRRLHYGIYDVKDLNFSGTLTPGQIYIKNSSFISAGGNIEAEGTIKINRNDKNFDLLIKTKDVQIDSLFFLTNNFDQKFITHRQIKGRLNSTINTQFVTSGPESNIDFRTIKAEMEASILEGQLKNFQPMQSLSKFIDEKKLENITFSELRNKIYVNESRITIPEMEIKSNVSTIMIAGTHTFDNEMDYRLTVPLKNFRKERKDKDEAFGAIEEDHKGNAKVFLTVKGNSSNYKISYDTKKTRNKIKEDLKKEGKELKSIFNKPKPKELPQNQEAQEFFDFSN